MQEVHSAVTASNVKLTAPRTTTTSTSTLTQETYTAAAAPAAATSKLSNTDAPHKTVPVREAHIAATAYSVKLTAPRTSATSTPTRETCVAAFAPANNALELGDINAPKTAITVAVANEVTALWTAYAQTIHATPWTTHT